MEEFETLNQHWSILATMPIDFIGSIGKNLRTSGLWSPVIQDRLVEFDRLCLAQIRDDLLREVVTAFLVEQVTMDFYLAPASTSGKNHPSWQSSLGGILLNTVECCIAIDRKMRIYPELTDSRVTRLQKIGTLFMPPRYYLIRSNRKTTGENGANGTTIYVLLTRFEQFASNYGLDSSWIQPIKDATFWHLGRFTPNRETELVNPRVNLSLTSFVVHELDMDFSNRSLDEVFLRRGDIKPR